MPELTKTLLGMFAGSVLTILTQVAISAIQSVNWRAEDLVYTAPSPTCNARRCMLEVVVRNAGAASAGAVTYELPPILGTSLIVEYGSRAYDLKKRGDQMVLTFGPLHPQQSAYFSVSYDEKGGSKIEANQLDKLAIYSNLASARFDDGKQVPPASPIYLAMLFALGAVCGVLARFVWRIWRR